jgi:hypothetical protein
MKVVAYDSNCSRIVFTTEYTLETYKVNSTSSGLIDFNEKQKEINFRAKQMREHAAAKNKENVKIAIIHKSKIDNMWVED